MKLEVAIKQKKFTSEYHRLSLNVLYTGNWLAGIHNATMKPFGISLQQYNVLRILRGQFPQPVTLGLVQERMLDPASNATRLVEKLRQKGLVDRRQCEHNRRQVDILITEQGLELLKEADKALTEQERRFKKLTEEEAKTLNELLDKLKE